MSKTIHFCEGNLALHNFILPICRSKNTLPIIFAGNINHIATVPAGVFTLPPYVRLGLKRPCDLMYILPTIVFLMFVFIRFQPQLVVSHMSLNSPIVLFTAFIFRIKNRVYFNHGFSYLGCVKLNKFLLFVIEYINFTFATRIITVSPSQRDLVMNNCCLPRKEVVSTYPGSCAGLSVDSFISYYAFEAKLHKILVDSTPLSITYIGRPFKRKGFPLILEIIKSIDSILEQCRFKNVLFEFNLIGVTEQDANKLSALRLNTLKRAVINFVGYTNDVSLYLSKSSIMLLPSFHEGFGYAYLEAAAQGNCLIGFEIPGPDSLLINMKNSYTFPINADAHSFANSIIYLHNNRVRLASLMKNAYQSSFQFERSAVLNSISHAI